MTGRFVSWPYVQAFFRGASVAIVGSGPSCTHNEPGFVDSHDLVVRVNNHRTGYLQGNRTDVHFSFYGTSIKKAPGDLAREGCRLCLCKLPNSQPLESAWHRAHGKLNGIDYRYIYEFRKDWWFTETFVPDDAHFLAKFEMLGNHQPTTGFAAILDVLACAPRSIYLTGFDGFSSGIHNVDEPWDKKEKNLDDPIRHRPDVEMQWLREHADKFSFDRTMRKLLLEAAAA